MPGSIPNDALERPDLPEPAHRPTVLRRFAVAIGNTYRTMDPFVAQVLTSPGVFPDPPRVPVR